MALRPRKIQVTEEGLMTQQQSVEDIIKETEVQNEADHAVDKLNELIPVLNQYNKDLVKGQDNIINERLGIESMIHAADMRYHGIIDGFSTLEKHIDKAVMNAPQKMTVTLKVSDESMNTILKVFDDQMTALINLHNKQMQELRDAFEHDRGEAYKRENENRDELHRTLKSSEGFYVSGFWYWVMGAFFFIGIFITLSFFVLGICKMIS